ncbi:MAG: hypothetical protein WAO83_20810 [Fuerstiella sp.]
MKKTLGFLLGLILRVALSVVIALWATSQLFVIFGDMGVQGRRGVATLGIGVMSSREGILVSVLDNAKLTGTLRLLNADDPNGPGNWATFTGSSRSHWWLFGLHVWFRTRLAAFQMAISFPTAVVLLIALYWFSRRLGRTQALNRKSLK